jgi:transposase InsO family protein
MSTQLHQVHPRISIRQLCSLFQVSRTWYYQHASRATAPPEPAEIELRDRIERIILEHPGYGYRRVARALARRGQTMNHKRVLRIMREASLLCQLKRRWVRTTDSTHAYRVYPNCLKQQTLTRVDQAWVADITYIRLPDGVCYLAAILDAYSRKCIGYYLSRTIDTTMALAALEMALTTRQPAPGLIHHSDQGVQYASTAYVARLEQAGIVISMRAKGNCDDNAKAESFFKTLKCEEVYLKDYQTFAEAQANIQAFIELVYNTKRFHSSLGYLPPVEFEQEQCARGPSSL